MYAHVPTTYISIHTLFDLTYTRSCKLLKKHCDKQVLYVHYISINVPDIEITIIR